MKLNTSLNAALVCSAFALSGCNQNAAPFDRVAKTKASINTIISKMWNNKYCSSHSWWVLDFFYDKDSQTSILARGSKLYIDKNSDGDVDYMKIKDTLHNLQHWTEGYNGRLDDKSNHAFWMLLSPITRKCTATWVSRYKERLDEVLNKLKTKSKL